jgi:hypothetical protein
MVHRRRTRGEEVGEGEGVAGELKANGSAAVADQIKSREVRRVAVAVGVIRVRDWGGGVAAGFYTTAAGELGQIAIGAAGGWAVPPPCRSPLVVSARVVSWARPAAHARHGPSGRAGTGTVAAVSCRPWVVPKGRAVGRAAGPWAVWKSILRCLVLDCFFCILLYCSLNFYIF